MKKELEINTVDYTQEEVWLPVVGWENSYEVSSFGNIRSVDRIVQKSDGEWAKYKGKTMTLQKRKDGYVHINLLKNSKAYPKVVHRLVAQAFIPNPENKPQVNHIDRNRRNNKVENIEWCTGSENNNYTLLNSYHSKIKGAIPTKGVMAIKDTKIIAVFNCSASAAEMINSSKSGIQNAIAYGSNHKGYKWRYL